MEEQLGTCCSQLAINVSPPAVPIIFSTIGLAGVQLAALGSIVILIKEEFLGVATALFPTCLAVMMIVFTTGAGVIAKKTVKSSGYFWVFCFSLLVGFISLTFTAILYVVDIRGDKRALGVQKIS